MARFTTKQRKPVRGSGSSNPSASAHRLKARMQRRAPVHTKEAKGAMAERALTVAALSEHTRRTQDEDADQAMAAVEADGRRSGEREERGERGRREERAQAKGRG